MAEGVVGYPREHPRPKHLLTNSELIAQYGAMIDALRAVHVVPDWVDQGLLSERDVAGFVPRLYYATDTYTLYLDDGTNWLEIAKYPYMGDYTGGDYTAFDTSTGFMTAYGNATCYDDLPPTALLTARVGSAAPTLSDIDGAGLIKQLTFAIGDIVYSSTEITHKYTEGSNLYVHAHLALNGTDATTRYVKYQFDYTISNGKGAGNTPYDTAFSTTATSISAELSIPVGSSNRAHVILPIGTITGTGIKIGAYIDWRFTRIAASSTAPAANPFVIAVGVHVNQNTMGSSGLYTK